eukprot:5267140-Alexandrium_andersonii.AAC.1
MACAKVARIRTLVGLGWDGRSPSQVHRGRACKGQRTPWHTPWKNGGTACSSLSPSSPALPSPPQAPRGAGAG